MGEDEEGPRLDLLLSVSSVRGRLERGGRAAASKGGDECEQGGADGIHGMRVRRTMQDERGRKRSYC